MVREALNLLSLELVGSNPTAFTIYLGINPIFRRVKMNDLERTLSQIDEEIMAIEEAYPDNYEDRDDWQDLVDEVTDLELNIVRLEK